MSLPEQGFRQAQIHSQTIAQSRTINLITTLDSKPHIMTEAQFADWSLKICLSVLVIFLGFIVWDLGKKTNAGKFGMFILFLVLGAGVIGLLLKDGLIERFVWSK